MLVLRLKNFKLKTEKLALEIQARAQKTHFAAGVLLRFRFGDVAYIC